MYQKNSNIEYNKELEAKLNEYLKQSDTLSNELLALKEKYAEQSKQLIAIKTENEQLIKKIKFFELEKTEQLAFWNQIKKAQELINNIKLNGAEATNNIAKEIVENVADQKEQNEAMEENSKVKATIY